MIDAKTYLTHIKTNLALSPVIASITIVTEYALTDRGYFRARLRLSNGDFLEVSEFFTVDAGTCSTQEYRYQWMNDAQDRLVKRWDNAKHFPDLPNFPHHIHVGSETHVIPGNLLSIVELLEQLTRELFEEHDVE